MFQDAPEPVGPAAGQGALVPDHGAVDDQDGGERKGGPKEAQAKGSMLKQPKVTCTCLLRLVLLLFITPVIVELHCSSSGDAEWFSAIELYDW
jgi:hypothetical protein